MTIISQELKNRDGIPKTKQKFSNPPSQNPNKNETLMYKQIEKYQLLRRNPNGKKTEENLTACNDLFTTS